MSARKNQAAESENKRAYCNLSKVEFVHQELDELATADDLARIFKVHRNTVYAWVTRREIPFVKLPGNTTRFPRKKVESWLQKRLASGKPLDRGTYLES